MLRLVHPSPKGKETRPSRRPSSRFLRLTDTEIERVRAAIRTLRHEYGSWQSLAEAMGVAPITLKHISTRNQKKLSVGMALRVARAAGVPLESLLSPIASVNVCPTCGARKGAK